MIAILIIAPWKHFYEPTPIGGPPTMRLMSVDQYIHTVHHLFGEDIKFEISFPPLQRKLGLESLGATTAIITQGALERFDRAARSIAMQVVDDAHRHVFVPCTPSSRHDPDEVCARIFFARVGRLLFRRPLTEIESQRLVAMATVSTKMAGDFYIGLAYTLAGMMTSPKFLYLAEVSEPDPDQSGKLRLDAFSKASRLSLFLWNSLPDDQLLVAAETGEIHNDKGLQTQIDRMLVSPNLEHGVRSFFTDILEFDDFVTLSKDVSIYPLFTYAVSRAAEEQTLRMIIDHLIRRRADYRDIFTSRQTSLNRTLAAFYQLPFYGHAEWDSYEFLDSDYAGLLSSLSFLMLHSHPGRSSPTLRGKAVRGTFLCQNIPSPPPNVNFDIFEDPNQQFKTARDRLNAHNTDPICAGCHKLTDPIGLALENFDATGRFRDEENGVLLDASGNLDGRTFTDVGSFGQAVREHPAIAPCLVKRLYAYGVGREPVAADRQWLAYMVKRFAAHKYRFPKLLREIAMSKGMFAVSAPDDDEIHLSKVEIASVDMQEEGNF